MDIAGDMVQKSYNKRFIILNGLAYVDKLLSRRKMRNKAQRLYEFHDQQALSCNTDFMRAFYLRLRNNAADRVEYWS